MISKRTIIHIYLQLQRRISWGIAWKIFFRRGSRLRSGVGFLLKKHKAISFLVLIWSNVYAKLFIFILILRNNIYENASKVGFVVALLSKHQIWVFTKNEVQQLNCRTRVYVIVFWLSLVVTQCNPLRQTYIARNRH